MVSDTLACCLSCRRRLPQATPYCSACGQRLWPPEIPEGPEICRTAGSPRFALTDPGVVCDRETGLIWQQGGSPQPLPQEMAGPYLDGLNRGNWGGRRDWRLPSLPELASLLTKEKSIQGLYLPLIFSGRQRICWTATLSPAGGAYGVLFYPGSIQAQEKSRPAYIRGVAGSSRGTLPQFPASLELARRGRDLLFEEGRRRVPRKRDLEEFLKAGGMLSEVVLGGSQQFYFLPTEEFFQALIRLFRRLKVTRVVEVGAWEGFVAAALTERGFPVVATDLEPPCCSRPYGVRVFQADHRQALAAFRPDLVFWCWPPMGSPAPAEILSIPGVKYYLEVGDGGCVTGSFDLVPRFRGRYLKTLSELGYTMLDVGPYRHNRVFLFKGAGGG
ncbi:MAG: DUF1566 domain-containing protein [Desulfobaccales bacterium]